MYDLKCAFYSSFGKQIFHPFPWIAHVLPTDVCHQHSDLAKEFGDNLKKKVPDIKYVLPNSWSITLHQQYKNKAPSHIRIMLIQNIQNGNDFVFSFAFKKLSR